MMKPSALFALGSLFLAAFCEYIWDESKIIQFAADDNLHQVRHLQESKVNADHNIVLC